MTFLAATPGAAGRYEVSGVEDPQTCLTAGGLVSPIFGAFSDKCPPLLSDGAVLLLYPRAPRSLLLKVQHELDAGDQASTFLTHGLASIGMFLPTVEECQRVITTLGDTVAGTEIWSLTGFQVAAADIATQAPAIDPTSHQPTPVDGSGLPYDAAAQVRQFNANVASIAPRIGRYAPEYSVLLAFLESNVNSIADATRASNAPGAVPAQVQLRNDLSAHLVELNAGLAMLESQLLSGIHPLQRDYPVAEYSLLGIGGVCRGIWGLYRHLNTSIAQVDHSRRLVAAYKVGQAFPLFVNRQTMDFAAWESSPVRLSTLDPPADEAHGRLHVLHFSSRYGFHETMNTMSASWQCVYASASRDWNLLTLSHEFLHAHVREIIALVFSKLSYVDIVRILDEDNPANAGEAMACAIVGAMHHTKRVRDELPKISKAQKVTVVKGWSSKPNYAQVEQLLEGPMRRYVQEMMVHALDYLYVYNGRDDLYVSSIWGSWTFVPAVVKRLHHYIVRTLVALAIRDEPAQTAMDAFPDAMERLRDIFARLLDAGPNSVVQAALDRLNDEDCIVKLDAEFVQAYYMAQIARIFFFDKRIARALQSDYGTAADDEGYPTYDLAPGNFPALPVESRTGFLLERFATYPYQPTDAACGRESLWQVLLLTVELTS